MQQQQQLKRGLAAIGLDLSPVVARRHRQLYERLRARADVLLVRESQKRDRPPGHGVHPVRVDKG